MKPNLADILILIYCVFVAEECHRMKLYSDDQYREILTTHIDTIHEIMGIDDTGGDKK